MAIDSSTTLETMTGATLEDTRNVEIPKTMADALEFENPQEALRALSKASSARAEALSKEMVIQLSDLNQFNLNSCTTMSTTMRLAANETTGNSSALPQHQQQLLLLTKESDEMTTVLACADSILESLTKIATGGTQASQEIRLLEEEKRRLEQQAQDVETAWVLRKSSDLAAEALSSQNYTTASQAVADYTQHYLKKGRQTHRALAYAGEYTVQQMETTTRVLKETLLQKYQIAAIHSVNLQQLSDLTPLLQMLDLEKDGVAYYLQYLQHLLNQDLEKAKSGAADRPSDMPQSRASKRREEIRRQQAPPYVQMARIYNSAVTILRHHLPMVSHYLWKADGDAALVQLVQVQVEQVVVPLFQFYIHDRQLHVVAKTSQKIYGLLEERYVGRIMVSGGTEGFSLTAAANSVAAAATTATGAAATSAGGVVTPSGTSTTSTANDSLTNEMDDCGFRMEIGTLADVDGAMEEAALCLQHYESYQRFLQHTVDEVNKARALRKEQVWKEERAELERQEWATGMSSSSPSTPSKIKDVPVKFQPPPPLDILPSHSQLKEAATELGGYYSVIERCLLLASMQRAFSSQPTFCELTAASSSGGGASVATTTISANSGVPLKTSLVDTCLFAARRSAQRAFATGHCGTASATTNFCGDTLGGVLLEVMTRRAQDSGVAKLKPGSGDGTGGLLEMAAGGGLSLFNNTSNLIMMRQGAAGGVGGVGGVSGAGSGGAKNAYTDDESMSRRQKMQQGIARACATLNDLFVASNHVAELERLLSDSIEKGFPPTDESVEQLRVCVRNLTPIKESYHAAAMASVETLVGILKPKVRSLVSDAVGSEGSSAVGSVVSANTTSFMGSAAKDRTVVRMNYHLVDDAAYKMAQLSEGYMSRLLNSLSELLGPLRLHLAPPLADALVLGVVGTAAKRLEGSLRRCQYTALGALCFDSDVRDLVNFTKQATDSNTRSNNFYVLQSCTPLARLLQIAKLLNVDDLQDVVDLISVSKRKQNWDLKLEDTKAFLSLRVEFESRKVNELLSLEEENQS